ncbi:hypothetical protein BU24DRAFT_256073 [Aaosphaeria arxii CBS 175.79]|uniref:Uncharacterized protein n=1 Tax=Aaosphaeria arxii CBS 175.79 TaxID=1450172 RepID=A0A6A5XIM8_9PLEO|nr:uncharacterized protein BU24DRAFT_256073 [Aaosphaeria arxii CBS 175.79]KAF2012640.1 hypothetical protein BU24DRAFT_256073 [Aaosphaeria arxii CBS 175.79]
MHRDFRPNLPSLLPTICAVYAFNVSSCRSAVGLVISPTNLPAAQSLSSVHTHISWITLTSPPSHLYHLSISNFCCLP